MPSFKEYFVNKWNTKPDHMYQHMTNVYSKLKDDPKTWNSLLSMTDEELRNSQNPKFKAVEKVIVEDYDGHSGFSFFWTLRNLHSAAKCWGNYVSTYVQHEHLPANAAIGIQEGDFNEFHRKLHNFTPKKMAKLELMDLTYEETLNTKFPQIYRNAKAKQDETLQELMLFDGLFEKFRNLNPEYKDCFIQDLLCGESRESLKLFLANFGSSLDEYLNLETMLEDERRVVSQMERVQTDQFNDFDLSITYLKVVELGWEKFLESENEKN